MRGSGKTSGMGMASNATLNRRAPTIGRLRSGMSGLIYGGFALLVVVIVAASVLGASSMRRIERTFRDVQRVQRANDLSDDIERSAFALRLAVRDVISASQDPTNARKIVREMTRQLQSAQPGASAENHDMLEGMLERLERIRKALEPGGIALSAPTIEATTLDEEARLIARVAELMRGVAAHDTADLFDHLEGTIDGANRQSIAVGLICILLGAVAALVVVRRTVLPLRQIVGTMGEVTAGFTDVSPPYLGRRDEIGDIARATQALKHALAQVRVAQGAAQRALADRATVEAQYQQLFEQSADGIYQTTPDGRLLRANPALIAMMGYSSLAEMLHALGVAVESVYVEPDDHQRFREMVDERGAVHGFEYRARRADGAIIWLADSATVVRDADGAILRYEGMLRDITEQKGAEDALAESRRRLREVIDTVPASINVKDRNLRFSIMNRYMATLLGIDPDDAIGRTTGELMARYRQSKSADFDQEVLRTRKPLGYYEDQYADASGTMRYWLTTKIPLLDERGEVDSIVTCAMDIGERKRAEIALQAAKDTAEAATEAKSQFLAQMSHEIRTPMNGVLGMIEILEHTDLNDAQRKLVGVVRDSASSLLRIINDILDLSKLEADKLDLEEVNIALDDLVDGVEATLAAEARAKGLSWTVAIDSELPPKLRGDPVRLRQVLLNLAANAVKFTEVGSVHLGIARHAAMDNVVDGEQRIGLRIVLRDTGIGMDAEAASRLFRPFEQTDASITRRFGGTGLGLSICRRIVTLMGGTIHVESTPGEGSSFIVLLGLPVALEESGAPNAAAPVVDAHGDAMLRTVYAPDGSPARQTLILVADDHPTNREVLQRQLAIIGYAAETVNDGEEALEALARKDYALLLTDCHMPVLDGFELTARIRAEEAGTGRHLPIIAITANALVGESARCIAAGMDEYMAKPVQMAQLRAMLERFVPLSADKFQANVLDTTVSPPLDLSAMAALFDDDKDAMRRTLAKFLAFANEAAARLRLGVVARANDTVAEAERLSSAAATVGAQALAAVADTIRERAHAADWMGARAGLSDLERALDDLAQAIRALGLEAEPALS